MTVREGIPIAIRVAEVVQFMKAVTTVAKPAGLSAGPAKVPETCKDKKGTVSVLIRGRYEENIMHLSCSSVGQWVGAYCQSG